METGARNSCAIDRTAHVDPFIRGRLPVSTTSDDNFLRLDEVRFYLEWFVASATCGATGGNGGSESGSDSMVLQLGRNKPGHIRTDEPSGSSNSNADDVSNSGAHTPPPSEKRSCILEIPSTVTSSNNVQGSSSSFGGDGGGDLRTSSETYLPNGTAVVGIRNSRLTAAAVRLTGQDIGGTMAMDGSTMSLAPTTTTTTTTGVMLTPDEFILRELADIRRLLLQRFLMQGGGANHLLEPTMLEAAIETDNELFEILGVLTDLDGIGVGVGGNGNGGAVVGVPGEPTPHFAVGDWVWTECDICLEHRWLYRRPCCGFPACGDCMKRYFETKVADGTVKIECCSPRCRHYVHRDEISARLDGTVKHRFYQFLVQANADPHVKTCPGCNHITRLVGSGKVKTKNTKKHPERCRMKCSECGLTWCFSCQASWHDGITCRQYRKGDRLLKSWAHEVQHGQVNAQKCPKCQVYIQRTTGCDHMHCTRCKTDFCYRCGDRLRKLRFFGDHYSKLSIFGCKYRYKADKPLQRKLIRGAVFGGKLMVAPVLGTLGACAGAIALGFGIFILPVYGGVRLYQRLGTNKHPHFPPRFPLPQPMFHFGNEIPMMTAVEVHHHGAGAANHNRRATGSVGGGGGGDSAIAHRSRPPQWTV